MHAACLMGFSVHRVRLFAGLTGPGLAAALDQRGAAWLSNEKFAMRNGFREGNFVQCVCVPNALLRIGVRPTHTLTPHKRAGGRKNERSVCERKRQRHTNHTEKDSALWDQHRCVRAAAVAHTFSSDLPYRVSEKWKRAAEQKQQQASGPASEREKEERATERKEGSF